MVKVPALPGRRSTPAVKPEDTRTCGAGLSHRRAIRDEARKKLDKEVALWLEPHGVPRSWKPSAKLVDEMILELQRQTDHQGLRHRLRDRAEGRRLPRAASHLLPELPAATGPPADLCCLEVPWRSSSPAPAPSPATSGPTRQPRVTTPTGFVFWPPPGWVPRAWQSTTRWPDLV